MDNNLTLAPLRGECDGKFVLPSSAVLALAACALLIAQFDSQGRYARMIDAGILALLLLTLAVNAHRRGRRTFNEETGPPADADAPGATPTPPERPPAALPLAVVREKGAFVAAMSNGVQTPINDILAMLELLGGSGLNAGQLKLVATMRAAGQSLSATVNDIVDFSSIESGKLTLEHVDFDLRQLVESTADVLARSAVQKQLEFLAFIAPGVPTALRGDPGRLRQMLLNLVGNAIKFTRAGEVTVRVEREEEDSTRVKLRFSIIDTGIGIAPEAHARLFEAYSQPEEPDPGRAAGAGLGLSISRQLVALMGGGIDLESAPGKGSTFWFTVRLEKQPQPAAPAAIGHAGDGGIGLLRGARVLVVDDNATCRELVCIQLNAWGMQAAAADSGGAALAQMREQALAGTPFAVALIDLNLGSMDGFTLAWAISSQAILASARLILMTSLGLQSDGAADQQVGIAASVSKPLKQDALLMALQKALRAAPDPITPRPRTTRISHLLHPARPVRRSAAINTGGERVLLADDNPINRKMTLRQLANLGYVADAVSNGRDALVALRAQPYAVVMLDVHMPELDGYQTAEIIRRLLARTPGEHLALIAITANRAKGDRERCLEAGMNDYLSKPVSQEDLRVVLERWNPRGVRNKTA